MSDNPFVLGDNPFVCQFQILYCKMPIVDGAVGYGGFSKEQLRSDDSILQNVLDNLYKIITEGIPLPSFIGKEDVEVIMYLPDLIN